jgi:hypothetical protein
VAGALGVPGLLIWLAWFGGVLVYAARGSRRLRAPYQGLALVVAAITIGYLLNNLTAPPDQNLFVAYVFSWLAGIAVQLSMRRELQLSPPARQAS